MLLSDLIDEVINIVTDPSLGEQRIINLINEGYERVAARVTDPLPDLEKLDTVRTDTSLAYVNLPPDYHRNLEVAYDQSQRQNLRVLGSLQLLSAEYPGLDHTGNIDCVAVMADSRLYYQGIPSTAHTLTLHYFKKPTVMVRDMQEPLALPSGLHRRLLVNYACKEIFSRTEDGMDGQKTNTNYHSNEYEKAFIELEKIVVPRSTSPIDINDTVNRYLE